MGHIPQDLYQRGKAPGLPHDDFKIVTKYRIAVAGEFKIMYVLRRIYKTKPGQALRVATLVQKQGQIYHDAGQRGEFRVSFNGGTMPGEQDTVCLEWTDEKIESPYRGDNKLPAAALELGPQVRELVESQRIEFMELLTPDKYRE